MVVLKISSRLKTASSLHLHHETPRNVLHRQPCIRLCVVVALHRRSDQGCRYRSHHRRTKVCSRDILSWHGWYVRARVAAFHVSSISLLLLFLILYTVSKQTTYCLPPAPLHGLERHLFYNIVRGIKNQRPRQPVPSTLLALTSAPGGLIRTNKHRSARLRSYKYSGRSFYYNCRYSTGWRLFREPADQIPGLRKQFPTP